MPAALAAMAASKLIGDMINSGRDLPTADMTQLFQTINQAGAYQRDLIEQLPENLKPLYDQYQTSLGQAGAELKGATTDIGQNLLQETKALYGPDSDVVKATLAGLKTQDYSTLPGTLTNLKAQLAATGGLSRGGASKAITQAVMAPAQAYSGQAQSVMSQQLQAQQQNVQAALNKIAQMDDATAQSLFGMSTKEASDILQYGRQDLQNQLSDLINQSTNQTNQLLATQGIQANNAYQNAVTRNAQLATNTNDITGIVGGLVGSQLGNTSAPTPQGLPAGADVGSASYYQNALANSPLPK
jgi:hypothetical protein